MVLLPQKCVTAQGVWRYVLDTNVCLDMFVFDDPGCVSLLAAARAGEVEFVTRKDCRAEWQAVLSYTQLKLSAEHQIRAARAFDANVRCLDETAMLPENGMLPRCRDRDDQKFLELAYQSGAVALLTRDDALLRLARRAQREGLFAILPPALWREAIS